MKFGKLYGVCVALLGAQGAFATEIDMSGSLICAAIEVVACTATEGCASDTPDKFNLPVLLKIDAENKSVESVRVGGAMRASAISTVADADGISVLQGIDGASGWTATIEHSSGSMTIGSAHGGVTYSVFGTCASL